MQDDEQAPLNTQVALLRQDFSHMSSDISEMKQDFKEFKLFYYTKEQAANMRSEFLTAHNSLANRVDNWERGVKKLLMGVAILVIAAILTAYVFHIPKIG